MSTTGPAPVAATTNVVGYFNNQRYPINLVISALGITIEIKPGEYIRDRQGRKINDPVFDAYRQLSRETSPTPVAVIAIPVFKPVLPATDGQTVRQVTEFTRNERGFKVPVMPQPKDTPSVPYNNPAIRAMSVEEARRLRLIRPTRHVPEDYGVTDTDSAMAPRNIPMIVEARDTPAPVPAAAMPAPLPKELLVPAPNQAELQKALLEQQQQAEALDADPTGFLNTVVPNPPADALPVPQVEETPAPVPAPTKAPPQPLPPKRRFVCGADGRQFDFRSQLEGHVRRKYPHMLDELMAAYPKES